MSALALAALSAVQGPDTSDPDLMFWHDFELISGDLVLGSGGPVADKTASVIASQTGNFAGSGQHAEAPSSGYGTIDMNVILSSSPPAMSFSLLYNARGDGSGIKRFLTNYRGTGAILPDEFLFDAVNRVPRLVIGGQSVSASSSIPMDNQWHQVGFRFDQGTVRFFSDGLPLGSDRVVSTTTVPPFFNDLHLIEDPPATSVLNEYFAGGYYDNAGLWKRALTDTEMRELAFVAPDFAPLFDHDFEEVSGNVITAVEGPTAIKDANIVSDRIETLENSTQHLQAPSDGVYGRVDTGVTLSSSTSELSFSVMYNARGSQGGIRRFLSTYSGGGSVDADEMLFDSVNGELRLVIASEVVTAGGIFGYYNPTVPEDHDWHQIGFRFDSGDITFFLDGQPVGDPAQVSSNTVPAQSLSFALIEDAGNSGVSGEYFANGDYDNAGLWLNAVPNEFMRFRYASADEDPFANFCNGDGGDQMGCTDCPCGNNAPAGTIGGCTNQTGNNAQLIASGSPALSATSDDLSFDMLRGNPGTFAILLSGDNLAPQNPGNPCFGLGTGLAGGTLLDGLRCAVGGIQRHGGRPMDANGDVGLLTNGWGGANGPAPSLASQGGFVPGQTRYFQVFYRSLLTAGCLTGQNSSQAVGVTFRP